MSDFQIPSGMRVIPGRLRRVAYEFWFDAMTAAEWDDAEALAFLRAQQDDFAADLFDNLEHRTDAEDKCFGCGLPVMQSARHEPCMWHAVDWEMVGQAIARIEMDRHLRAHGFGLDPSEVSMVVTVAEQTGDYIAMLAMLRNLDPFTLPDMPASLGSADMSGLSEQAQRIFNQLFGGAPLDDEDDEEEDDE